jgi:hypothetical protein
MTYFIAAWIVDGDITLVEADTSPITQNHAPEMPFDLRIIAEVSGEYQDAAAVRDAISLTGETLTGLDFVSQVVEWPTKP